MSGLNGFSCFVLRLANLIAGPDRQDWVMAMAAETHAAGPRGNQWALGGLYAATKDRMIRDALFLAALIMLPAFALVLVIALTFVIFLGTLTLGVPDFIAVPLTLLGPLPVAWLLGMMRPKYPPLLVGTIAFFLHQAVPAITMWAFFGNLPSIGSPSMPYFDIPGCVGLLASWLIWVGATWRGGDTRKKSFA